MISVIVPVYNSEKYLKQCVDSICNQTYKELEIILVDDGSTDNSSQICDQLAEKDKRIIVIHKENGGSTSARNAGLRVSKGEYIGFVDSDDWIEPEMYETLLKMCVSNQADIAIGTKYINHLNSQFKEVIDIPIGVFEKNDSCKNIVSNIIYARNFKKKGISPNLCDKLFIKDLLLKHQLEVDERTKFAEDDVCVYSCLLDAEKVAITDVPFYHYRMHESSVCHSIDDTYFEKISIFYQQMKKVFMVHEDSEILMQKLKKYMFEFVLRGVNYTFGFSRQPLIPFFQLPYKLLSEKKAQEIVLYGAGKVGQDYYQLLKNIQYVKVVGWVDKQYDKYKNQDFPIMPVEELINMKYDHILVAIESEELGKIISENLISMGVSADCILWEAPENIISNLGEML